MESPTAPRTHADDGGVFIIDQNRDALFSHLYDTMAASSCSVMVDIYPPRTAASEEKTAKMTVANRFLGQLSSLIGMLMESSTRFVRCIKTNEAKAPSTMDKPSVLRQVCQSVRDRSRRAEG